MLVIRMLFAPREALEEVQRKPRWAPFFLFALLPVALGAVMAFFFKADPFRGGSESSVSPGLILAGMVLLMPVAWIATCAVTSFLLSRIGALLCEGHSFRLLFAATAAATVIPSLQGVLQNLISCGSLLAGHRPWVMDDTLLLFLGDAAPKGLLGSLIGSLGFFRLWQGLLLTESVSVVTGQGRGRALLQVAPVWLAFFFLSVWETELMQRAKGFLATGP